MASGRRLGQRPDCHTFLCKFWHFQIAVSQWKLAWLTPNLGILWISVCSFWLCGSTVANPIIYRLVPSPSWFETRQWLQGIIRGVIKGQTMGELTGCEDYFTCLVWPSTGVLIGHIGSQIRHCVNDFLSCDSIILKLRTKKELVILKNPVFLFFKILAFLVGKWCHEFGTKTFD